MTALALLVTRIERAILANHRRRTLASNARHALPPNPTGSAAMTTRRPQ